MKSTAPALSTLRLEELTGNAWPALQTRIYDGWLMRSAKRVSKRSNSVWPLYGSTIDPEAKINECERYYHAIGQRCIFKLTDQSEPADLDARLAARGYQVADRTLVQTRALDGWSTGAHLVSSSVPGMQIRVKVGFSDAWFQAFAEASSLYTDGRDITVALFRRIQDPVVTAAVPGDAAMAPGDGGPALACGYGVIDVESGFVGLYGISVAPEARRRGLGRAITVALLHAAVEQGANSAYLQVVAANAAAQGLYAQLDFVDRHAYWYRVEE